jgi:hypothetical protein
MVTVRAAIVTLAPKAIAGGVLTVVIVANGTGIVSEGFPAITTAVKTPAGTVAIRLRDGATTVAVQTAGGTATAPAPLGTGGTAVAENIATGETIVFGT